MIINYDFGFLHNTEVIFGENKIECLPEKVGEYGKRAIVISDKGISKTGIVQRITEALERNNIETKVYDNVVANPRDTSCQEAADMAGEFGAEVIVGVGGGSAMDTAKAVNVLMTHGGTCSHWAEVRKFDKPLLPLICVPTTSGTGSEVTFEAVITATDLGRKVSMSDGNKLAPKAAVMDPALTLTVPPLVTASTGMDALTHAIEAYTCKFAQPISDALAIYAIKKIAGSIETATNEGDSLWARRDMMLGSLMAGIAFTNSYLGAVHSFSERLGGFYDIPHGIANAIFLPFVTEFNISADYEKHAAVAAAMGIDTYGMDDREASEALVKKLFEMNEALGIPKFSELEMVNPKDFPEIAHLCETHPCGFKANPRDITYEDYMDIFNKAYKY